MPLYEYLCSKCGEKFEIIQKFADQPLAVHEACGGSVERLISAPGLHFKGSGWYITDYARGGSSPKKDSGEDPSKSKTDSKSSESKTEGKSESKSEGKSEGKSESKSETRSDAKTESKPAASTTKSDS